MAVQVQTILGLQAAPLTYGNLVSAIFITIWLFVTLGFAYILHGLLHRPHPTWPEFRDTLYSSLVLGLWYFFVLLDRWLRYDGRPVVYGYIIPLALWEFIRVSAGIYLQWGLYKVVWRELVARGRIQRDNLWRWWLAAKFAIAIVFLVAVHYLVLQLATAIVWVRFDSLNTIQDIATKRNAFEITTAVFSSIFAALTVFAATNALRKGHLTDGGVTKARMALWAATVMILARSLAEIGITAKGMLPDSSWKDTALSFDISYGLLTCLYFVLIGSHAVGVASPSDRGNEDTRLLNSNLRKHILEILHERTSGTRVKSPDFEEVLQELEYGLDALLAPASAISLTSGSRMSEADNRRAAVAFIRDLRARVLPDLIPKEGQSWQEAERARNEDVFGRISRGTAEILSMRSRHSRVVSNQSMRSQASGSTRNVTPAGSDSALLARFSNGNSTSARASPNHLAPGPAGARTRRQQRHVSDQSMQSNSSADDAAPPMTGPTPMHQFGSSMDPIPERIRHGGRGDAGSVAPSLQTAPSIFAPSSVQNPSFQARQQQQQQSPPSPLQYQYQHQYQGGSQDPRAGYTFPPAASSSTYPRPFEPYSARSSAQWPATPPPASIQTPSPHATTYAYPPVAQTPPPQPMYRSQYRASPAQQQEGRRSAAHPYSVSPYPTTPPVEMAAEPSSQHVPPSAVSTTSEDRHLYRLRSDRAGEAQRTEMRYGRPLPSQIRSPLGQEVEMTDVHPQS